MASGAGGTNACGAMMRSLPAFQHVAELPGLGAGHSCSSRNSVRTARKAIIRQSPRRGLGGARPELHQARPVPGHPFRLRRRGAGARSVACCRTRLPPFRKSRRSSEIRSAFGAEPAALFADFGQPVAAASIAQVHRARTAEGRDVAVKILRPGIEKQFRTRCSKSFCSPRELSSAGTNPRAAAAGRCGRDA